MKKLKVLALALICAVFSPAKADEGMCERAGRFLEKLKAENNHIIRSWSDAGLPVASAADSQALIQLQKEYCDKRKCLYCRFGYEYLRKK